MTSDERKTAAGHATQHEARLGGCSRVVAEDAVPSAAVLHSPLAVNVAVSLTPHVLWQSGSRLRRLQQAPWKAQAMRLGPF